MLVPLPALPAVFSSVEWTFAIPQQKNRSEFTGRTQTIAMPGAEQWRVKATALPQANEAEARLWRAFIASLRGAENTFNMPALPLWPAGAANPTVTAAVAGNRAVTVDDSGAIELGMYATVLQSDGHARMAIVVGIDGLDVHFEPYLTAAPTLGAAFIIDEPYCPMRLTSGEQTWRQTANTGGFQLEAEEAL